MGGVHMINSILKISRNQQLNKTLDKQAPTSGKNVNNNLLKSEENLRKEKKAEGKNLEQEDLSTNPQNKSQDDHHRPAATFSGDETVQERLQPIGASNTSMLADDVEAGSSSLTSQRTLAFQFTNASVEKSLKFLLLFVAGDKPQRSGREETSPNEKEKNGEALALTNEMSNKLPPIA